MDTNKKKTAPAKMGRKPLPETLKRVRVGIRIKPQTKRFLDAMGKNSLGRAIDEVVSICVEAGIDPSAQAGELMPIESGAAR